MTKTRKAPPPAPLVLPDGRLEIPIECVLPNPEQPRTEFEPGALADLAQSIRENGVILPLAVEAAPGGMFILHDGERRLRAAKLAGLARVPAAVCAPLNGAAPSERLARALVANVQRADLGPVEEARAYQRLVDLGYSVNELALKLGVSAPRISGRLKLLELDAPIQALVERGRLPKDVRLTEALLDISDKKARIKTAETLAERSATIKAGVEACRRVTNAMQAEGIRRDETPALHFATRKAGAVRRPLWDAFAQVGKLPPWLLVEISAREVCETCALRDTASDTTCRGCALVEVLARMIGKAR